MNPTLVIELLDFLGLDFMDKFINLHGMKYILVVVHYASK